MGQSGGNRRVLFDQLALLEFRPELRRDLDARMQASLKGFEDGVVFAEGHRLDDASSKALVPPKQLGRMLSVEEAKRLLKGLS
jgi:hypothetical protein